MHVGIGLCRQTVKKVHVGAPRLTRRAWMTWASVAEDTESIEKGMLVCTRKINRAGEEEHLRQQRWGFLPCQTQRREYNA